MPYANEHSVAWRRVDSSRKGASSFGVDSETGVPFLILTPESDGVAIRLEGLPADAVTVRISGSTGTATDPTPSRMAGRHNVRDLYPLRDHHLEGFSRAVAPAP